MAGRSAELGWEPRVGVLAWPFPLGGVGVLIGFPRRSGPVGWSGRCCKALGAGVMVGRSGVTGPGTALVALRRAQREIPWDQSRVRAGGQAEV